MVSSTYPERVLGVVLHVAREEQVGHRGTTHGGTCSNIQYGQRQDARRVREKKKRN